MSKWILQCCMAIKGMQFLRILSRVVSNGCFPEAYVWVKCKCTLYIVHAWPKCVKLVVSCNNQEEPWAIKWDHPWCPDNLNLSVGTLSLEMQFYVWGSPRPSWPPPSFPYYISTTTNSNFKIRHMLHTYAQNYFPRLIKFCMNMMIMTTMMITMPASGQCVENLGSVWS